MDAPPWVVTASIVEPRRDKSAGARTVCEAVSRRQLSRMQVKLGPLALRADRSCYEVCPVNAKRASNSPGA